MPRSRFTPDQLEGLNGQADELLVKLQAIEGSLERISQRWEKLPSEDDVNDLKNAVGEIERSLCAIPELFEALPSADDLEDLESRTGAIATNMAQAVESATE